MKRKMLSCLLALCMVFTLFAAVNSVYALDADIAFAEDAPQIPAEDLREAGTSETSEPTEEALREEAPGEEQKADDPEEGFAGLGITGSGSLSDPLSGTAEPNAATMTWATLQTALSEGGTVTLTNNVRAGANDTCLMIPADVTVTLDLNGRTINRNLSAPAEDGYVLKVLGDLTLTDSSAAQTGKITGGYNSGNGGGVYVNSGATFTMTGGSITGNTADYGGGVFVQGGAFTMEGGTISGNMATTNGGGVGVVGFGAFTMNDGAISNNTAGNRGGGVYVVGAFTMTGGVISGNTADMGGGVNVYGTSHMEGGAISGNTAGSDGGGVLLFAADAHDNVEFTMIGGSITGNTAGGSGGGMYIYSYSIFTMTGGSITGNTAATHGGGVYLPADNTEFWISGSPVISGNTVGDSPNNVYLSSGMAIYFADELTADACIGVTTAVAPEEGRTVEFTAGLDGNGSIDNFFSDNDQYDVVFKNWEAALAVTYDVNIAGAEHGSVTADSARAMSGTAVTLTDHPDEYYELVSYTVTAADGTDVPVTGNTFTMPAQSVTVTALFRLSWELLQEKLTAGGAVILRHDAKAPPTLSCLTVPTGVSVTLDLNGHTIDRNLSASTVDGCAIFVLGSLTVKDTSIAQTGMITGGSNLGNGGGICAEGMLTLQGGAVTGNHAANGGGIYADYDANVTVSGGAVSDNTADTNGGGVSVKGALTLSGGVVTGNRAASGGGILADYGAEITISGGSVTGNTAEIEGGGVLIDVYADLALSGSPAITGNTRGEHASNLHLDTSETVQALARITGSLTGAEIGVSVDRVIEEGEAVIFTSGLSGYMTDLSVFSGDDPLYLVDWSGNGAEAVLRPDYMTWSALQAALNEGGLVTLTNNIMADPTNTALVVPSGVTVTLDLNGFTLDRALTEAVNNGYVLRVEGDLTLTDSSDEQTGTITGGKSGGVYVYNGAFTMEGGTISGNTKIGSGGGIYVYNGTFTMEGGAISGNTAISGNIANYGGGVCVDYGTFTMTGGEISGNTSNNYGGGVYVGGTFTMEGGKINGNTTSAYYGGGGVYVSGTFTMTGGSISGNTASGYYGGGVYVANSGTFTMEGGEISGNTAGYYGGGVYVRDSGTFTMEGGEISGNTSNNYGGGVYVGSGTFTMNGGAINGNTASGDYGYGGGVYVGGTFTMEGGEISGNTSNNYGGGVYVSGTFRLSGTPVITGNVKGGTIADGVLTGGIPQNVYLPEGKVLSFTGALRRGASIGISIPDLPASQMPLVFTDNLSERAPIDAFISDSEYLAVDWNEDRTEALLYRVSMTWPMLQADLNAGGTVTLMNDVTADAADTYLSVPRNVTVTLDLNGFTLDRALTEAVNDGYVLRVEGDMTLTDSSPEQTGSITGGNNTGSGGGVVVAQSSYWNGSTNVYSYGTFTMNGGAINGNTASAGGGVYVNGGTFTMTGGEISGNTVSSGGGVYVNGGTFTMTGGEISGNTARGDHGYGGGVYVANSGIFTMEGGAISGNTANTDGGGVFDAGNVILNEGSVDGNFAFTNGGGFYVTGTLTMNNGEIVGNIGGDNSSYGGGGVTVGGGLFTMKGGSIHGNTGARQGGGVNAESGTFIMEGGVINGNTVGSFGGGVYVGGTFMMTGGEISGNTASESGGGVFVSYYTYSTFNVSGTPVITGNVQGGTITDGVLTGGIPQNVYLQNGKTITVTEALTEDASVGVTTQYAPSNTSPETITSGLTSAGNIGAFFSDSSAYCVNWSAAGDEAVLAVRIPLILTSQPEDSTVFAGETASFGMAATGEDLTYSWQFSTDGGEIWQDCGAGTAGADTPTLQVEAAEALNGALFRCAVTDRFGETQTTETAALTVISFEILDAPADAFGFVGKTVDFHVSVTGTNIAYQWQYKSPSGSWTNCASFTGRNTDTLTVPVTAARNGYQFRCRISGGGMTETTDPATLTVFAVTVQPADVTAASGTDVTFHAEANGEDLTYRWQYIKPGGSWTNLSSFTGYNTDTLTVPAVTTRNGYQYRCRITCQGNTITTGAATLTVTNVIEITEQPQDMIGKESTNAAFHVGVTGLDDPAYQWQYKKPGGEWTNCASFTGRNTDTLTVPVTAARNGYQFRCRISGSGDTQVSEAATLTVLLIMAQPANVTAASGTDVTFHAEASGENLTYRWQYKKPGGSWTNLNSFTGYNTDTLTVPAAMSRNGYQYRCRITCQGLTVITKAATLTVTPVIEITAQPEDVFRAVGTNATFHVEVGGTGSPTFQWQYKKPGGSWTNCTSFTGRNTDTLTVPVTAARNGYQFRCQISSGGDTLVSEAATLTVFAITAQPTDVTAASGTDVTFHVEASGENLTYRWQYKKPGGSWTYLSSFTGHDTDTLTVPATVARSGNQYRCRVTLGDTTLTSNAATLTVG